MAYQKKQWKNRISTNPTRRLLTPTDGSAAYTVDVSRAEGTIMEEGDAFNADVMNDLEDRIEEGIGAGSNIVATPELTSTASRAYSVNEFLVYNNKMYKVISAIASGASLVPGVNLQELTVGQELTRQIGVDGTYQNQLNYGTTPFYLDYQGGRWGWNSSAGRGAGTFHPFNTDDVFQNQLNYGGTPFYFDYKNGKWGWNSSPSRGAGTFHPFKQASSTGTYTVDALFHVGGAENGWSNSNTQLPRMTSDGVLAITQSIVSDYRDHTSAVDNNIIGAITITNLTRGTSVSYSRTGNYQYSVNVTGKTLNFYAGDVINIMCEAERTNSWHAYAKFVYTITEY